MYDNLTRGGAIGFSLFALMCLVSLYFATEQNLAGKTVFLFAFIPFGFGVICEIGGYARRRREQAQHPGYF